MKTFTLAKRVKAQRYIPGNGAPDGCVRSKVEVHWAADHKLIYFSFAKLRPAYWMGVNKLLEQPQKDGIFDGSWVKFTNKDGTIYWREAFSFSFFSVKSEASVTRNWTPVFVDEADDDMVLLATDYISMSGWVKNPGDEAMFSNTVEFREVDGSLSGGYRSHYLSPSDWLTSEQVDGKTVYKVMTNAEFEQLKLDQK